MVEIITQETLLKTDAKLERYRRGKTVLENRLKSNERWYRMRHWEEVDGETRSGQVKPVSGWLFNAIASKHADMTDALPKPLILPREEGDREQAEALSAILPVVLEQAGFEEAWGISSDRKLKSGTGAYAVLWDAGRHYGLGDVSIRPVDLLKLYWEPGVEDIQDSPDLFYVTSEPGEALLARYPHLVGKTGNSREPAAYPTDDAVDRSGYITVVDWYYKKQVGTRQVLHYCKYACGTVLYSTENAGMERGLYDHGMYPFFLDPLFRMEGSPCGFGYIDVGKSSQEYIDRSNQAILENLLANARPRYFIRGDGAVKESEFADLTKDFIHVDGNLGQDSVLPVTGQSLSGIYLSVVNSKIDELKETTGNRDVSQGGATGGVIAASAIAAMQEAGSKLSRDCIRASYRVVRDMCGMVIELIRQFYDLPRCFRILGDEGMAYMTFSNAGLRPASQGEAFGQDTGLRSPLFDVEVVCEKASPYSRMSRNELALSLYKAGLFAPERREEALICLDMMDFDGKQTTVQRILKASPSPAPTEPEETDITGGESAVTRSARLRAAEGGHI